MTISVTNTEGDESNFIYSYLIVQRDYQLEETSGITLYSMETDEHPNGLCLENLRPLMISLADSASIDIYTHMDDQDPSTLAREWRTNTDIYFARVNTFDYAGATQKSVTETFASSIGNPRIKDLKNDDIILVGRGNRAIGAIKIIQVFDEQGSENRPLPDYIKRISRIRKTFHFYFLMRDDIHPFKEVRACESPDLFLTPRIRSLPSLQPCGRKLIRMRPYAFHHLT